MSYTVGIMVASAAERMSAPSGNAFGAEAATGQSPCEAKSPSACVEVFRHLRESDRAGFLAGLPPALAAWVQHSASASASASAAAATAPGSAMYLNHFRYDDLTEEQREQLVEVGKNRWGTHLLQPAAANAFDRMREAAKEAGVTLSVRSAYRDFAEQEQVFAKPDVNPETGEATLAPPKVRAKARAPAGYSEHHTGYALDITAVGPDADAWLDTHAPEFDFELSFPMGNRQKINYERWHYRYVGTDEEADKEGSAASVARAIFAPARDFAKSRASK